MFPQMDDEGYLTQPDTWTREVAESIAEEVLPVRMGDDHWKVIDYLRKYFSQFSAVPPVRMLCQQTGIEAPRLRKLFPSGLLKGACKIAGLPREALRGFLYP